MMPQKCSTQPMGAVSTLRALDARSRRTKILEEEFLRRAVEREKRLRADDPALWRELDLARQARNQETAAVNRRLRAEGLRPVSLELALSQRVKKLQQLEAPNKAKSAKPERRS
jgi:hypothetical protein